MNNTNSLKKIYLKVINPNAKVYELDIISNSDYFAVTNVKHDEGYIYPFECNGKIEIKGKTYYKCNYVNGFVIEDDVEVVTREEYIKENLNREISKIKIPFEVREGGLDNFLCKLHTAVTNSVHIITSANDYYNVPEWILSTRKSFINCVPSEIYFSKCAFKDDSDADIELWVKCARPGIFIGRMGENINYWESLLQAYIDKWCDETEHEPIKLGIRIEEKDLFAYESCELSL